MAAILFRAQNVKNNKETETHMISVLEHFYKLFDSFELFVLYYCKDHNELMHMSQQQCCRDICKIS